MGLSYSGSMIIGARGDCIDCPEGFEDDLDEWAEEVGLSYMSEHYDADIDCRIYGFKIPDIKTDDMDYKWIDMVKLKAEEFKKLTGVDAMLIGTQNIN